MTITVVEMPQPIVQPEDLGAALSGSPFAEMVISAVTSEFDGPTGTLGRAIGPQVIELTSYGSARTINLPCPPLIEILSVERLTPSGFEVVASDDYRRSGDSVVLKQCGPVIRIRYRAGYDGDVTGEIPASVKQAIILKSSMLLRVMDQSAFLKADEVDGVGRFEYSLPEQVNIVINDAIDRMLSGLKVYRI